LRRVNYVQNEWMRASRTRLAFLSIALSLAACVVTPQGASDASRAALAPIGKLRVGLYPGSPTSYIPPAAGSETRGVAFEVGRELALRLGVAFEPVVFPNNAKLLEAVKAGEVDFILTNATEERRRFIDFGPPILQIEKGYLVPANSKILDAGAIDRAGIRVGVSQGSSSQSELGRELHHATLVPVPTLKEAGQMLSDGRLDAFGTNKAILFDLGDGVPGSRVLPGHWGLETIAPGIPKGREAGRLYLESFTRSMRSSGVVSRAAARAGVRGTIEVTE
jgi:polar amino acid transport system substrate-binding protein